MLVVPPVCGRIISSVEGGAGKPVRKVLVSPQQVAQHRGGGLEQADIRGVTAGVGVDGVDLPDQLAFTVKRVDTNPGGAGVMISQLGQQGSAPI